MYNYFFLQLLYLLAVLVISVLPVVSSSQAVSQAMVIANNNVNNNNATQTSWDAIIIGSGLAGLSAALTVLDAGGRVLIVEKEANLGGNSMKASSGINAVIDTTNQDDASAFRRDTMSSAGDEGDPALIDTLVSHSHESVLEWLQSRLHVDLSQVAQLGGHSLPRTHRPGGKLPIGAEIMIKLQTAVKVFEEEGSVKICTGAKAHRLLQDDQGRVNGIVYADADEHQVVHAANVVLATGGFAADRSSESWLAKVRPELLSLGATAGGFSTGDGLSLATSLEAKLVGMEHIQVHPTGFVDPKDPDNPNKFLAAEVLRGVGGILLTPQGKRYVWLLAS
jgi:succinate dehydrogenase/fumarate reductase flavoprotein subunit